MDKHKIMDKVMDKDEIMDKVTRLQMYWVELDTMLQDKRVTHGD